MSEKDKTPRYKSGKAKFRMDFISDKELFKAVMFACKMIQQGQHPAQAVEIAADYYDQEEKDVHFYVSQRSGRSQHKGSERSRGQ